MNVLLKNGDYNGNKSVLELKFYGFNCVFFLFMLEIMFCKLVEIWRVCVVFFFVVFFWFMSVKYGDEDEFVIWDDDDEVYRDVFFVVWFVWSSSFVIVVGEGL